MHEERTRDRQTKRVTQVFRVPKQKPFSLWPDLACIISVERSGTRRNEPYEERGLYISSQVLSAEELAAKVRGHWQIENGLHWVKDAVLGEDACTTRAGHAPQNLGLLRSWTVTLYRLHGFHSITQALRRFAHDVHALFSLLE